MSRTSVGVPAFSCSDLTPDGAVRSGADDSGRQELPDGAPEAPEVLLPDVLPVAVALAAAAGDSVRINSSTCSKHPRRISYQNEFIEINYKLIKHVTWDGGGEGLM